MTELNDERDVEGEGECSAEDDSLVSEWDADAFSGKGTLRPNTDASQSAPAIAAKT